MKESPEKHPEFDSRNVHEPYSRRMLSHQSRDQRAVQEPGRTLRMSESNAGRGQTEWGQVCLVFRSV